MIAAIDIDGVLADLHRTLLRRYNNQFNDNLKREDIKDWGLENFVKPECGKKIYEIFSKPGIYTYVKPINLAIEGINKLRELRFEIAYVTHSAKGTEGRKYQWLIDNNFWNKKDHYVETKSKYLIRGDIMIDDYWKNLENFIGYKILFDQPWNRHQNHFYRACGWKSIIDDIDKFYEV